MQGARQGCGCTARLVRCDAIAAAELRSLVRRNRARVERYFAATARAGASVQATRAYLTRHQAMAEEGLSFLFGIRTSDGDRLAGLIFVTEIDPDCMMAELGGFLDAEQEGRGLMQAAMTEAFVWCGNELGLDKVRFLIAPENTRAIALANALGFAREQRDGRPFRKGRAGETVLDYYGLNLDRRHRGRGRHP